MKIYFNGIELVALCVCAICFFDTWVLLYNEFFVS